MIGLILAAAGSGQRFCASTPKQFAVLKGRPLYQHSLDIFRGIVDEVAVVVPGDRVDEVEADCRQLGGCAVHVVAGGKRRQDSVRNGLVALSTGIETVLIHDAARPFASSELVEKVLEGAVRHGVCIPALAVSDTVKEVEDGWVVRTLDRGRLRLAQTPQGFNARLLREAFGRLDDEAFDVTDEAALMEQCGHRVAVVAGERLNLKITVSDDLASAEKSS